MKIKQFLSAALLASAGLQASAAVVLSEDFNDIGTLAGAGWVTDNLSVPVGSTGWFQGNAGVFGAASGAPDAYIAANFENAAFPGAISNWLFTPEVTLGATTTLAFQARVAGEGFLDTIQVLFSGNGGSTALSDFAFIGAYSSSVDEDWVSLAFNAASGGGTGRFAFRYFVADTSTDGNYIGIDSVVVRTAGNAVPVPATLALAGLALALLSATRRKAA